MSIYGKIISWFVETFSVRYCWPNSNAAFLKKHHESKAPSQSPQEISGFLKIPWVFRAELFSREYLNYSNITWKRSLILKTRCVLKIFSKPRRIKNSAVTGVIITFLRMSLEIGVAMTLECKPNRKPKNSCFFSNETCPIVIVEIRISH